ncbi:hypothetical protein L6Q96_12020, partial [Candidatus Binatia bacterium]|nr:hypothetical protein [Candidatus Binatia bacterium]
SACYEESVLKWLANPERPEGPQGTIGFTISADMSILFTVAYARRDRKFGNGRFVRNVFEEMCNRQAMRLTSAGTQPTREALQTMKGPDVPLDQVGLDSDLLKIENARWRAGCPACHRQHQITANMLGGSVICDGCQAGITVEWPPLIEHGIADLERDAPDSWKSPLS